MAVNNDLIIKSMKAQVEAKRAENFQRAKSLAAVKDEVTRLQTAFDETAAEVAQMQDVIRALGGTPDEESEAFRA